MDVRRCNEGNTSMSIAEVCALHAHHIFWQEVDGHGLLLEKRILQRLCTTGFFLLPSPKVAVQCYFVDFPVERSTSTNVKDIAEMSARQVRLQRHWNDPSPTGV